MADAARTYATVADVQRRYDADFVDLICFNRNAGAADYSRLQMSLEDATGEIDSYLTAIYDVPLDFTPPLVARMCIDMAIYHTAITADKCTDAIESRYKGWIAHLVLVAKRQVGLGIPVGATSTDANGNVTTATAQTEGTGGMSASFGRTMRV